MTDQNQTKLEAKTMRVNRWNIRIVENGDSYGLDLIHDNDKPLVEFYDSASLPDANNGLGQFVSRYYAHTLLGLCHFENSDCGLDLQGGVPEWTVSAADMQTLITNLKFSL